MASEYETLRAISSHGDLNPIQSSRLKELEASGDYGNPTGVESKGFFGGAGGMSGGGGGYNFDPIAQAQKLLDFQKKANEPVVQSLQGQIEPLKQRYNDLLTSIKGQQSATEGYTTQATTSELGRRGLMPQSEEGQRVLGQALAPVAANYQGLSANAGLSENQDLMNLATHIAQLQAGNPDSAMSSALGIGQMQQQASQFAQQAALQKEQFDAQAQLRQAQANYYNDYGSYRDAQAQRANFMPAGKSIYDILNGNFVNPTGNASGATGGGSSNNYYGQPAATPNQNRYQLMSGIQNYG